MYFRSQVSKVPLSFQNPVLVGLYGYQVVSKNNQKSSSWKYPVRKKVNAFWTCSTPSWRKVLRQNSPTRRLTDFAHSLWPLELWLVLWALCGLLWQHLGGDLTRNCENIKDFENDWALLFVYPRAYLACLLVCRTFPVNLFEIELIYGMRRVHHTVNWSTIMLWTRHNM